MLANEAALRRYVSRYLVPAMEGGVTEGSPAAAMIWAVAEIDQLRAELAEYRRTVTTGGPAVPYTKGWMSGSSSEPASATDPTAPRLRR